MNNKILILLLTIGLFGCGGGGSSSNVDNADNETDTTESTTDNYVSNDSDNDYISQETIDDSLASKAISLNVDNLFSQAEAVDEQNYQAFYERIKDIEVYGVPNLNESFKLDEIAARTIQSSSKIAQSLQSNLQKTAAEKRVNTTYNCLVSGSAKEVIDVVDRSTFEADTYKKGDEYTIIYNSCNMGTVTYDGSKTYLVNEFSEFDFSKVGAGDPKGYFTTRYDQYSLETSTQKVTMDGDFIYKSEASYPAISNAAPTSLYKEFSAIAGTTVTFLNKQNDVETILAYDGILLRVDYTKKLLTDNDFTYCRKSDYDLTITENNQSTEVQQKSNFCGDVIPGATNELYPPNASVFDDGSNPEGSTTLVNNCTIVTYILEDGATRYNYYDNDSNTNNPTNSEGLKIYPYETGRIIYQREGVIGSPDSLEIDYVGTRTFIFKDWGNVRVDTTQDDQTITHRINTTGETEIKYEQDKDQDKWIGWVVHKVDFEDEEITIFDYTELHNALSDNPDLVTLFDLTGGDTVNTGSDNVLGYPCQVYFSASLGSEACHHQTNLVLYSSLESDFAQTSERAISVEFNIPINDSEFDLPNFTVIDNSQR